MSIPVIDTLNPLGNFPVAKSENIDVNGTSLNAVLSSKVDKVSGKGLSTNDYSNADKSALSTLSSMFDIVD